MFTPSSAKAQGLGSQTKSELPLPVEERDSKPDELAYYVSDRDFAVQATDSVKQKPVQKLPSQVQDSTAFDTDDDKATLLGYELDTKFARISASPRYKDGELRAKVKASAVRFSANKEWTKADGTQVRRGFTTRLRYEGEASYHQDQEFQFQSKYLDTELGLEQRYDKTIENDVKFSHRYFAGARYRYRFGEESGSEVRALLQTEQRFYKNDAFRLLGQDFGWQASSKQTFETNWGKTENIGSHASFELEGLVTKKVELKVLGKKRQIQLKAGPELRYSTRNGFSVRPEVGMKVRL